MGLLLVFLRVVGIAAGLHTALIALALVSADEVIESRQLMYEGWVGDNAEVFVFDVNRGLLRNLTHHRAADVHPVWSPDGRHIAFESLRDGTRWVYIMDADGRNVRRLTTQLEYGEADPAWSEDGTRVIFRAIRRRISNPIFSVDVTTGATQQLDLQAVPRKVDTERVVFMVYRDGGWGIYASNPERTTTYPLLRNNLGFSETPHWSADDSLIAFLAQTRYYSQVYVLNADGSGFRQVTFDRVLKIGLSWRP